MINYFKLTSKISLVNWTTEDAIYIENGLKAIVSQSKELSFFEYCKKWKLAPWTYIQLTNNNLINLLSKVSDKFNFEYQKVKTQNVNRNKVAVKFLKAFVNSNIDVIVLKGNYFGQTVYNNVGYKRMNDFDILVKKEDWDKIQDIYLEQGFIPLGFGWSGEKETPADYSHVGMQFISSDFSCIIGTQWGLKSPTTNYTVDINEAWNTAIDFNFYDVKIKALSYEYNMLHLILHLGVYKCGIRDCMDLYNLEQTNHSNHKKLIQIITESNACNKTYFALTISNLCVPIFSDDLISKFKSNSKGFLKKRLKKRLNIFNNTGDIQSSYNDYFQDIEKVVIYFNLFPKFHLRLKYYLKILRMIYFPKKEIVLKLNDIAPPSNIYKTTMARIKSPYIVFSLIAQEIGWKFTILLFVKLFVDLILSLKNYFYKKESYFDYLKNKGVNPLEIEKAVKNIQ